MLSPDQRQQIDQLLYDKRKIEAIKLHRGWTGQDLKESKEVIDRRCEELQRLDPVRFPKPSGCLFPLITFIGTGAGFCGVLAYLSL